MHLRTETETNAYRQRCYVCFRPVASCFCHAIPSIDNRTHILILQHVKERFHAFNTARIVKQALRNSTLIVDQTSKLAHRELPFHQNTGVLFPGPEARLLSDVPAAERPEQLVILDGTWHHAKTFMQQISVLQTLPRFRLDPAEPSNYRIRKEPTDSALSTLEATVDALRSLEPDTLGFDLLLRAFDTMVDSQIEFPHNAKQLRLRKRPPRPPENIPTAVINDLDNVVVAYGESAQRSDGVRQKHRRPIYWVAERLGTGERFEIAIQTDLDLSTEFLQHLELSAGDFASAVSPGEFCESWKTFLKPTDTLAVFKESTLRLLSAVGADFVPSVTMKCVNLQNGARTLDKVLEALNLHPPKLSQKGRAGRRLANAVCFARYLHTLGNSYVPNAGLSVNSGPQISP